MTIGDLIVGVDDIKLSIRKILERINQEVTNAFYQKEVHQEEYIKNKVKEIIKSEMGELGIK